MLIACIYAYVCPTCAGQTRQDKQKQTEIRRDQLPGTRVTTSGQVDTGNGARTSAPNYSPIFPAFLSPSVSHLYLFCFLLAPLIRLCESSRYSTQFCKFYL